MSSVLYTTRFGSLESYEKGGVQVINDDVRHYAFSNCFEIAASSRPYEKVVFGINQIYVLEVLRAEGVAPWFTCAHDEFVVSMDKGAKIDLIKLDQAQISAEDKNGAVLVKGEPVGRRMGWIRIKRGHQAMLPKHTAYRFSADQPGVLIMQTCLGELSVQRWAQICQTV
jgi:hypothetical protein